MPHAVDGRHLGRDTCRSTTAQRADMQPELHQTPLTHTLTRQVAAWAGCQGRGTTQLAPQNPTTAGPRKTRPARPVQPRFRDKVRPARGLHGLNREILRPAQPLQRCFREKVRPARQKTPILGHFSCAGRTFSRSLPPSDRAGRTFSRTGHSHVATVKPTSPLRSKTAPKTPISQPQRRWRFQSHTGTSEQRRRWFQTTGLPHLQHPNAAPVGGGGAWP